MVLGWSADKLRERDVGPQGLVVRIQPLISPSLAVAPLRCGPLGVRLPRVHLLICRCPKGGVVQGVGGRRRADHLAVIVDGGSSAGGAAWEGAEVDHHTVVE